MPGSGSAFVAGDCLWAHKLATLPSTTSAPKEVLSESPPQIADQVNIATRIGLLDGDCVVHANSRFHLDWLPVKKIGFEFPLLHSLRGGIGQKRLGDNHA